MARRTQLQAGADARLPPFTQPYSLFRESQEPVDESLASGLPPAAQSVNFRVGRAANVFAQQRKQGKFVSRRC